MSFHLSTGTKLVPNVGPQHCFLIQSAEHWWGLHILHCTVCQLQFIVFNTWCCHGGLPTGDLLACYKAIVSALVPAGPATSYIMEDMNGLCFGFFFIVSLWWVTLEVETFTYFSCFFMEMTYFHHWLHWIFIFWMVQGISFLLHLYFYNLDLFYKAVVFLLLLLSYWLQKPYFAFAFGTLLFLHFNIPNFTFVFS